MDRKFAMLIDAIRDSPEMFRAFEQEMISLMKQYPHIYSQPKPMTDEDAAFLAKCELEEKEEMQLLLQSLGYECEMIQHVSDSGFECWTSRWKLSEYVAENGVKSAEGDMP